MSKIKEKFGRLKEESSDMNEFAKKTCEQGMCVSMGEGRRIWFHLEDKEKNKCPKK